MKHIKVYFLLFIIPLGLKSQSNDDSFNEFRIGISSGINLVVHTSKSNFVNWKNKEFYVPDFYNMKGVGVNTGLIGEYRHELFDNFESSIIVDANYSNFSSTSIENSIQNENGGFPVKAKTNSGDTVIISPQLVHKLKMNYQLINLNLLYNLIVWEKLGITFGPKIGLSLTSKGQQSITLQWPDSINGIITSQGTDLPVEEDKIVFKDEIYNANSLRLGLIFGINYEIETMNILVVPGINYNFPITNLNDADNWKVRALQFALDLRYKI